MASKRRFRCPEVPRRSTFSSPTLAVHQLARSETGTFPCKTLFGDAWGEVCSEERQRLHFQKDFFLLLSSRWIQARRNMSWGRPLAPFAVAAVCSVCCLTISTAPCCTQPSPACCISCWAPMHSDENPSSAAPSRMPCTAPLTLPDTAHAAQGTAPQDKGNKVHVGSSAKREQKNTRPKTPVYFYTRNAEWYFSIMFSFAEISTKSLQAGEYFEPRIQDNKGNSSPAY